MRSSSSALLLCLLACSSLVALVSATSYECRLPKMVVCRHSNGAVQNPQSSFGRDTYSYTLTVPYETTALTFQSWASDTACSYKHSIQLTNSVANGLVVSQHSPGSVSSPVGLAVGRNIVTYISNCGSKWCYKEYSYCVTRNPWCGTKGDPVFAGLRGQVYQVHGVSGEVYAIISDASMQLNSKFIFLNEGKCPIINGHKAQACWSHPGSYLGELGLITAAGQKVLIVSGGAEHGFDRVTVDGKDLDMEDVVTLRGSSSSSGGGASNFRNASSDLASMDLGDGYIVRNSSHLITLQFSTFLFEIENSDRFLNYRLRVPEALLTDQDLDGQKLLEARDPHGLLGQTYRPTPLKPGKQVKAIEGNVDDYMIPAKNLFGSEFAFNRFKLDADREREPVKEDTSSSDIKLLQQE